MCHFCLRKMNERFGCRRRYRNVESMTISRPLNSLFSRVSPHNPRGERAELPAEIATTDRRRVSTDGGRGLPILRPARIHPDTISYLSIVASLFAAIGFWLSGRCQLLLLFAPGFCCIRLFMNMLDGMVAMASDRASPRGEIFNDLPDRVSDILIFAGVAHSGLIANPFWAYWAIILALMTAYVGTLGQAVGARREFGGIMSKPWRMVALHIGARGSRSRPSGFISMAESASGTALFSIIPA